MEQPAKKDPATKKRGGALKVEYFKGNKIVAGDDAESSQDGSFNDSSSASTSLDGDDEEQPFHRSAMGEDAESDSVSESGRKEPEEGDAEALNADTLS